MLVASPILTLVEHGKWTKLMVAPVSAVKEIKWQNMVHQTDDTVANEELQDEEDVFDVSFAKALLHHLRDWSGAIVDPQAAHHRRPRANVIYDLHDESERATEKSFGSPKDDEEMITKTNVFFKESGLQNRQFLYKFGASRKRHYASDQRRQRLEG